MKQKTAPVSCAGYETVSKAASRRLAAAIRYRKGESAAPLVSEVGDEETAVLMARLARKYQIPIVADPILAQELSAVGKNQQIPTRLYEPVAKILVSCKGEKIR